MSHSVEREHARPKVGRLVYEAAIFGANTDVARDVEVDAAAVYECSLRLPIDSVREVVHRIKDQRSSARQGVRPVCGIDLMGTYTPGDYKLFAWEAIDQFEYFDPDLVRQSEGRNTYKKCYTACWRSLNRNTSPKTPAS